METIPAFITILFVLTTFFTVWQFYNAAGKSKTILAIIALWMILQTILSLTGFYKDTQATPPRFAFLLGPAVIFIVIFLLTKSGKQFIDNLDLKKLTLLHAIRVPVEITLFYISLAGLIPTLMTFEGNNFDILSGLTAPVIYYFVYVSKKVNNQILLVWNFICLGLLINIVTIAILSAQTPFQRLAFDQPNVGVTLFPFVWLPCIVVPIVLLSHLAAIRQLLSSSREKVKQVRIAE